MKKIYGFLLGTLATLALFVANAGAGIACYGLLCQPKFPEKLHK